MAGTLIVGAEDVLLAPDKDAYAASRPITNGGEIVTALQRGMVVGRVVVLFNTDRQDLAEQWARLNGFPRVQVAVRPPEDMNCSAEVVQWHQIERERAQGPVWLVVTAYPFVADKCQRTFQDVVLYSRRGLLNDPPEPVTWSQAKDQAIQRRIAEAEHEQSERHRQSPY